MLSGLIRKVLISTLSCMILFSSFAYSQSFRFRNYGAESNIPSSFIYSLVQDNDGYLWVGTGGGLSKFDGFNFYRIDFPDFSSERYPTASLKDKNGNLWFGCQDGTIYYSEGTTLTQVSTKNERAIVAMLEGPDKFIYIFPQVESVIRIDPDDPSTIKKFSLDPGLMVFSACFTNEGKLLLGTQENISIVEFGDQSLNILNTI